MEENTFEIEGLYVDAIKFEQVSFEVNGQTIIQYIAIKSEQ